LIAFLAVPLTEAGLERPPENQAQKEHRTNQALSMKDIENNLFNMENTVLLQLSRFADRKRAILRGG
jgi:hypothetical protein